MSKNFQNGLTNCQMGGKIKQLQNRIFSLTKSQPAARKSFLVFTSVRKRHPAG